MKTFILYLFAAIIFIFLLMPTGHGQSSSNDDARVITFGMGLRATPFSDDYDVTPNASMLFAINFLNKWRLEPSVSFYIENDNDEGIEQYAAKLGLGGFWMFQREKTNFYTGGRVEYTYAYRKYSLSVNNQLSTETTNVYAFGPFIGAEYFLGRHFSIGIETGLTLRIYNDEYEPVNDYSNKETSFSNESGLLIRFYF
jgi:hypothetical protein